MSAQTFTPEVGLRITDAAAQHIRKQLRQHPDAQGFRLGLKASGCSGFKYIVDLVKAPSDDDRKFVLADDIPVYVDAKSLPYINGAEIDFVKEGLNYAFKFNNPNVDSSCGCGESFSIKEDA
ncbi:iron-sulfur cluster assembly accessory protein [Hahella sp. KA22]|uniref:HesB/IscA family protein n=1 Tax=unclassified Hahella TaxID=2624107 RepID=UPI000FDDA21D|nr:MULTISPECIES: iron-sulfur cluster assembly accessory protein [unclassified Hahella]AZZ93981.1 iron-sulfur cluster assembly accessory protein [Hahella sp. KA22]QAY57355.1 iron-sulfur cluster assembly accessory protein [Hahella sp. KA22]WLQ11832.1 iron-sulfur cluster assembly accessory protein [Hahella sp. HNIBRBA332]